MAAGQDPTPVRKRWRALGVLVFLSGIAVVWLALTFEWDLSQDWEAGVGIEWMPMSFEFIGLMAVIGAAGAALVVGVMLMVGRLPRPPRHTATHDRGPRSPRDTDRVGQRRCRSCGSTEGLYPNDDICSECDVAYYS
jgi:hypothetical protein